MRFLLDLTQSILLNCLDHFGVVTMKCERCGRSMAYEQFYGNHEDFWGWRCIFCGEIIDDVILENRQWIKGPVASNSKKAQHRIAKKGQ